MARELRTKTGRAAYARRKAIIEPVFGQVDTCHGGKALLLRGLEAAEAEWHRVIACHNFRKLFGFGGVGAGHDLEDEDRSPSGTVLAPSRSPTTALSVPIAWHHSPRDRYRLTILQAERTMPMLARRTEGPASRER